MVFLAERNFNQTLNASGGIDEEKSKQTKIASHSKQTMVEEDTNAPNAEKRKQHSMREEHLQHDWIKAK